MKPSKDEVLAWAQDCQLIGMRPHLDGIYQTSLEHFAAHAYAAGAAAMKERAAKVCEGENDNSTQEFDPEILLWNTAIRLCAMKIRALGDDDE